MTRTIASFRTDHFVSFVALLTLLFIVCLFFVSKAVFGSMRAAVLFAKGERLFVDEPVATLVDGEQGQWYRINFRISNYTGFPVRLTGCTTTCGCATAEPLPRTLAASMVHNFVMQVAPRKNAETRIGVDLFTDYESKRRLNLTLVLISTQGEGR